MLIRSDYQGLEILLVLVCEGTIINFNRGRKMKVIIKELGLPSRNVCVLAGSKAGFERNYNGVTGPGGLLSP